MKKIFSIISLMILVFALAFSFSSCNLLNGSTGEGNNTTNPPESEHTHDYILSVKDATCTEPGTKTYTCECGDSYEQAGAAAKGHDFDADGNCKNCDKTQSPESYTINFRNTDGWASVYVYVWYTEGKGTEEAITTNYTGTWPGTAMTKGEGDWFTFTLEIVAMDGLQLIFNDGGSNQSADLDFNFKKLYWANGACFATKAEAEADSDTVYSNWYLRGSNNNWGTGNRFVVDESGNSVLTIELAKGVQFKLADAGWTSEITYENATFKADSNFTEGTDNNNVMVNVAGTYTFTIDASGNLTVTKL